MHNVILWLPFVLLMTTPSHAQELKTVASVDLTRYAGLWFEIASFPQRFQKGCEFTTATYTGTDKDYILVENKCIRNRKPTGIRGKAFVVKGSNNAKLKVQFFWPLRGKYWIIDLADDYSYAVVSHPNRKYLWILSRTSTMPDAVFQGIKDRLKEKGFDLTKLRLTRQRDN